MAEAVGLVASIVTLVEVCTKLTKLCAQYSKDVKHARDDISRVNGEIARLRSTCTRLETLLKSQDGKRLLIASQELNTIIKDTLQQLLKLEHDLNPLRRRKIWSKFGLHSLAWPFRKEYIQETLRILDRVQQAIVASLQIDQSFIFDVA